MTRTAFSVFATDCGMSAEEQAIVLKLLSAAPLVDTSERMIPLADLGPEYGDELKSDVVLARAKKLADAVLLAGRTIRDNAGAGDRVREFSVVQRVTLRYDVRSLCYALNSEFVSTLEHLRQAQNLAALY